MPLAIDYHDKRAHDTNETMYANQAEKLSRKLMYVVNKIRVALV